MKITTSDWRRTVAGRYLQSTLYRADEIFAQGQGAEGGHDEPLKWKLYHGVARVRLSDHVPEVLGDIRRVLSGEQPEAPTGRFDENLSTLLYLSYGFSRWEPGPGPGWPTHRTVPSARCFYPTELYVAVPDVAVPDVAVPDVAGPDVAGPDQSHVDAGVYHYDPAHHSLALLRKGNVFRQLGEAVGADLAGARCVLLVSSLFWKNAFKYRNYSYRLCTQEAGMVVGNALTVAAALGYDQHVHHQFLDQAVNRLLGLAPGQESVLAVVAVYPRGARPSGIRRPGVAVAADRLLAAITEISPPYRDLGRLNGELCGMVTDIDESSFLRHTNEFTSQAPAAHRCERGDVVPIEHDLSGHLDLVPTLRARNSGRVLFTPISKPVVAPALLNIACYSSGRYTSDLRPPEEPPRLTVRLVVNNVDQV
ncbi:MAG: SagB/ThcOx family dehydrogenase, partial [Aldersonia sp.]|nr:SagB/ThcOx family dehydrogenase [Aldersonia sp.]